MAAVAFTGVVPLRWLQRSRRHVVASGAADTRSIRSGLRTVRASPVLLPIALFVATNGLLFLGPYMVLCPLLVRDVYGGSRDELSLVMAALTVGTMAGSGWILWRGGPRHPLHGFRNALIGVSLCLLAIALAPPFPVFVALVLAWGWCHAIFFNTSRTLFQEQAPAAQLSRVLSVHALGSFGMAPLSNLGAGFLGGLLGPPAACAVSGAAMLVVIAVGRRWLTTPAR
jgi:hypothetical protein